MWLVVLFDDLEYKYVIDTNYARLFNKKINAEKYCDKLNKKFKFDEYSRYGYSVKEVRQGKE